MRGGYLHNEAIAERLDALELDPGEGAHGANLLHCYEALVESGFVPADELTHVHAWLADLRCLGRA